MSPKRQSAAALLLLALTFAAAQQDLSLDVSGGAKIVVEAKQPRLKIFPVAGSTSDFVQVRFGRVVELNDQKKPIGVHAIRSLANQNNAVVTQGMYCQARSLYHWVEVQAVLAN